MQKLVSLVADGFLNHGRGDGGAGGGGAIR